VKIIAALFIVFLGIFSGLADTNAIPSTNSVVVAKKIPWVSTISAGLTLTRGNSDTLLFTTKFVTQKKEAKNEWLFGADAAYGEDNSINNEETLHGLGQYNHLFSEKFYGYANAEALHDGIQDLKYRLALSPGAGYYFIKTKPTQLAAEIGPGAVTEQRGDNDQTYLSLRLAEHWDQKINESAKLWEKAELIPEVNHFSNYTMDAEIGIETALTKKLSLQFILDDAYVNEPAAGRTKNDVKLISGIAYKF
jgi:putative salt-induced outer membrane protein YdiY